MPARSASRQGISVTPGYKTANRVAVGTAATVLLIAVVQDIDGTPISLVGGQIESPGDPKFVPMLKFTNCTGGLTLQGLRPGVFELRLFGYPDRPVLVDIPAGTVGAFDAGTLRLPPAVGDAP